MKSNYHLLDLDKELELKEYLALQGWVQSVNDVVGIEKAGEGNMNLVLRVSTRDTSFIVKQSRPWVEKYPQIAAPENRLLVEVNFYEATRKVDAVASMMPVLLAVDPANRIAQFQDLGSSSDFTTVYSDPSSIEPFIPGLCKWLSALHSATYSADTRSALSNKDMRALNHEHIFHFPLVKNNQLDLEAITPGLQAEADRLKHDTQFVDTVFLLGERYLRAGARESDVLLHGDYYPGSWLNTNKGLQIIDPEFGFFGDAEFDVGVFVAHMLLAGCNELVVDTIFEHYNGPESFAQPMALQFAGVEIMRRLIGVAQLPLSIDLDRKGFLLQQAKHLVLTP